MMEYKFHYICQRLVNSGLPVNCVQVWNLFVSTLIKYLVGIQLFAIKVPYNDNRQIRLLNFNTVFYFLFSLDETILWGSNNK